MDELDIPDVRGRGFATTQKARKEYRCWDCGNPIKPGDQYDRVKFMTSVDGDVAWDTQTYHTSCPGTVPTIIRGWGGSGE